MNSYISNYFSIALSLMSIVVLIFSFRLNKESRKSLMQALDLHNKMIGRTKAVQEGEWVPTSIENNPRRQEVVIGFYEGHNLPYLLVYYDEKMGWLQQGLYRQMVNKPTHWKRIYSPTYTN